SLHHTYLYFSLPLRRPLCFTLFPYTTLFRSVCCPVTSQIKGYPFEVVLPQGLTVTGAVLSDHLKNLDWRARHAVFKGRARQSRRSEEHTSELQSRFDLVCRLLLEKKKKK